MALIVETGSASASSESLCSVAVADSHLDSIGKSQWTALTTTQKEQALRRATAYMEQVYKARWQGLRVNGTQALDWPRVSVIANGYAVESDSIPLPVQKACAELALRASTIELIDDVGQQKTRTKVAMLEVEYDKSSPRQTKYAAIDLILAPYFAFGSGITHGLVR